MWVWQKAKGSKFIPFDVSQFCNGISFGKRKIEKREKRIRWRIIRYDFFFNFFLNTAAVNCDNIEFNIAGKGLLEKDVKIEYDFWKNWPEQKLRFFFPIVIKLRRIDENEAIRQDKY